MEDPVASNPLSLPHEIYAKDDGSHGGNTGTWQTEDYKEEGSTKYIREDLAKAAIISLMMKIQEMEKPKIYVP